MVAIFFPRRLAMPGGGGELRGPLGGLRRLVHDPPQPRRALLGDVPVPDGQVRAAHGRGQPGPAGELAGGGKAGDVPDLGQMSMPRPVCPNMAAATPSARLGPRRRRSSTPGRSRWTRSHLPPESVLPEARRKVSALVRRAYLPDTSAAPGPEPGTWKDPDPGGGAAGDQSAQDRPACPAMAATRRLRPVPSQRLPGAMISGAPAVL